MSAGRRGPWIGALVVLVALAVAAPAGAAKRPDTYVVSAGSATYARLDGSNGYRIHFSQNRRNGRRHFKLRVTGRGASVSYEVPGGRPTPGGVVADLGRRGRFDLRFEGVGKVKPLALGHNCQGLKGRWQDGYLIGIARFRGERGYTRIRVHRIPALTETWPEFRCRYDEGGHRRKGEPRRAQVISRSGGVEFDAVLFHRHAAPAGRRAVFRAWKTARVGRLSISREVRATATESTFAFPDWASLPEETTVSPPAPFTGTATFNRTPESTFTWTGDLAVRFPGSGRIRLAGPSFSAGVCALRGCVSQAPPRE
jgi:hypothetical protein